jgi:transcriptional regulator with XRE-family HTH domain
VQRRRLGIELRRLREAAGKSLDEVAAVLECSDSKVSRIENGQVTATPRDVRDMLDFYDVSPDRRDELVEVARTARKKGWWEAYSDTPVVPLVGLEVAADRILAYEPMAVFSLLQTRRYAQAMIQAMRPELPEELVERWVGLRMARQELLKRDAPPIVEVILEECAVHRPVGGRHVLMEQLESLLEATTLPALTLRVLPLQLGEHAAISGAFTIYGFTEPRDPDVVYLEHMISDMYVESPEQVARYSTAFGTIRSAALPPEESASFVMTAMRKLA